MNNLNKFINFTERCPSCSNDLKLYMTWLNSMTFKATSKQIKGNKIHRFEQALCKNNSFGQNDYLSLLDNGEQVKTKFNSSKLAEEAKVHQIYFFQICGEGGFKESNKEFQINAAKACYYRSTPFMQYTATEDGKWSLLNALEGQENAIFQNEVFSFKKKIKELEHTYILDMNYGSKETKFYYYTVSDEERVAPGFRPKRFDKTFPLLSVRPKVGEEDREKLIDRFNSWIIVS